MKLRPVPVRIRACRTYSEPGKKPQNAKPGFRKSSIRATAKGIRRKTEPSKSLDDSLRASLRLLNALWDFFLTCAGTTERREK
jgi:hypothetical protein